MNLTARAEQITKDAWKYGGRVVQLVSSRKLTRLERVGEFKGETAAFATTSLALIDKKIQVFNQHLEYGPQYPDYWAK